MTRNAKPGETCVNCGQVARDRVIDAGGIDGQTDPVHYAVCGCDTIDGPQVVD